MGIKRISADETLPLRHSVLWPDKPVDFCRVENDDEGEHWGLFDEGQLLSVASIFFEGRSARLRKFATDKKCQGQGLGTMMLNHIIADLKQRGMERFWCDARVTASAFYTRFGLQQEGPPFIKKGLDYVVMAMGLS